MTEGILRSNNESISQLQKVLGREGNLWTSPTLRVNPSGLDQLPVYVIPDDLVQLLSGRAVGSILGVSEWRDPVHLNAHLLHKTLDPYKQTPSPAWRARGGNSLLRTIGQVRVHVSSFRRVGEASDPLLKRDQSEYCLKPERPCAKLCQESLLTNWLFASDDASENKGLDPPG
jgi:hypothetical protein